MEKAIRYGRERKLKVHIPIMLAEKVLCLVIRCPAQMR